VYFARRRLAAAALLVASGVLVAGSAGADFNPFGRSKAGRRTRGPASGTARPPSPGPAGSSPAPKAGGAPPARGAEGPSDALVARYTALVLGRPGEPFPLERLVELYRQRDGGLDKLIAALEARAANAGPEHYAALVALAGVYRADAQHDRAVETYRRAISEAPHDPVALLALGRLYDALGDKAGARKALEQALPSVTADAEREQLLHSLMGLCLDLSDVDAAKKYHEEIVRRAKGSFFARAELGRELFTRGEYARAEAEFRDVAKAAAGDNRALAPALKDLGQALEKEGKHPEALDVLTRALSAAGGQSGLRREILDAMVDVYRATGGIATLVTLLEKEHAEDFERLVLLGSLYEETGRVDDALTTYKRALTKRDDIATRQKVVQLLEVRGQLDEAIHEYEALVRAAPRDPEFVFHLAEALIQRGDRPKALRELERLEARAQGDDETLTALVDFYERIDESDRAVALLDRLSKRGGSDPRHLVELGDHYYRKGDTKRAVEIWERIRLVVPDRAKALHALGEVLLEHDMPDKALDALKQASELAPKETKYQKALALALERTGTTSSGVARQEQHEAAQRLWEKLLHEAGPDKAAAREARQHIVTLWGLSGRLSEYARPLERRLAGAPPDLEAGRLLGELYTRLRRPGDAERVYRAVASAAPGDEEAYLGLERALVAQRKLDEAIQTLSELVKIDGRRARDYYQRMAQYAAELYRDDDAIRFASKAVELSPDDAEGHKKLGEMYRRRQDVDHAVLEFRRAISKNDRLFPVYFDLAELLLTRGEVDEADRLLRRVVRASPDDDLVARATRLSVQVNLGRGSLESLERELLPVALGNPGRPIYRRLLVEVYGNLAFPLVHEAKNADPAKAAAARDALRRIGERAVKPLLDALSDDRDSQQRTAIELLSHISNRGAGPALVAFAMGKADGELRARAMLAAGALRDPALIPRFRDVIAPAGNVRVDETDTVAIAAAFSIARMQSEKARPLLVSMLSSDAPSVRAFGAIGLGLLPSRADVQRLAATASAPEQGFLVRAAAAFALGAIGGDAAAQALSRLGDAPDPLLRGTSVIALSRLGAAGERRAVAAALVSGDAALRDAGAAAALVLATREYRTRGEPLPIPDGRADAREALAALRPSGYTADERARALAELAPELAEAAVTAVHATPEGARVVADALLAGGGRPAFAPLTDDMDGATPESEKAVRAAVSRITEALVEPFVALARHPSADVRARAVRVLSLRSEPAASSAVIDALSDPDPLVQEGALAALGASHDPRAVRAVTELARSASSWPVRARAAEALGAFGGRTEGATAVLGTIADRDPIAFVREAAVRALGAIGDESARAALERVAAKDDEPRLRTLAASLLGAPGAGPSSAR
jgi:tetratricopeptide (TPR) repeat protein/HEAT repeat protein